MATLWERNPAVWVEIQRRNKRRQAAEAYANLINAPQQSGSLTILVTPTVLFLRNIMNAPEGSLAATVQSAGSPTPQIYFGAAQDVWVEFLQAGDVITPAPTVEVWLDMGGGSQRLIALGA
jgi:hypothetical protein